MLMRGCVGVGGMWCARYWWCAALNASTMAEADQISDAVAFDRPSHLNRRAVCDFFTSPLAL